MPANVHAAHWSHSTLRPSRLWVTSLSNFSFPFLFISPTSNLMFCFVLLATLSSVSTTGEVQPRRGARGHQGRLCCEAPGASVLGTYGVLWARFLRWLLARGRAEWGVACLGLYPMPSRHLAFSRCVSLFCAGFPYFSRWRCGLIGLWFFGRLESPWDVGVRQRWLRSLRSRDVPSQDVHDRTFFGVLGPLHVTR